MIFEILLPTGSFLKEKITQLNFESIDGFASFLPHHIDMVTVLKPSILSYKTQPMDSLNYIACNEGILIKKGDFVTLTTRLALKDTNLNNLIKIIQIDFKKIEEERKEINATMAHLEIGLQKGLLSLNKGFN